MNGNEACYVVPLITARIYAFLRAHFSVTTEALDPEMVGDNHPPCVNTWVRLNVNEACSMHPCSLFASV